MDRLAHDVEVNKKMSRPTRVVAGIPLALAALVSGCATNLSGTGVPTSSSSASVAPITADESLFKQLPASIQQSKTLVVGTSPTWKPMEFLQGGDVVGLDMDLLDAVGKKLGVTVQYKQAPFDSILIGLTAQKYDVGVSSFTVNKEREKSYDMVSYMVAGSQWTVQKGNPKKVTAQKFCGQSIAVQTGTVQEDEVKQAVTTCGSNPPKLLSFEDQADATAALIGGRATVMAADSPVALYAVKMNDSNIEALGDSYGTAPYGVVSRKSDTTLAPTLAKAFAALEKEGQYKAILATWNETSGGITNFEVNP